MDDAEIGNIWRNSMRQNDRRKIKHEGNTRDVDDGNTVVCYNGKLRAVRY
jgi:hypothetical protein